MSMSISCHLHEVGLQMAFVVCDDASKSGVRQDDAIKDCMCLLQSLNKVFREGFFFRWNLTSIHLVRLAEPKKLRQRLKWNLNHKDLNEWDVRFSEVEMTVNWACIVRMCFVLNKRYPVSLRSWQNYYALSIKTLAVWIFECIMEECCVGKHRNVWVGTWGSVRSVVLQLLEVGSCTMFTRWAFELVFLMDMEFRSSVEDIESNFPQGISRIELVTVGSLSTTHLVLCWP